MDPKEHKQMEDGQTPTMRMIKGATTGLVPGILLGTLFAVVRRYEPPVGSRVALSGLIPSLMLIGDRGFTFAVVGGVWVGVEMLLEKYRMKSDYHNDVAGGLVAGASVLGYKLRKIPGGITTAISVGFACANMPIILHHMRRTRSDQKSRSGK